MFKKAIGVSQESLKLPMIVSSARFLKPDNIIRATAVTSDMDLYFLSLICSVSFLAPAWVVLFLHYGPAVALWIIKNSVSIRTVH